ncbi:hypothetical protein Bbelb_364240, partial [Branchiostoma belcheri]
SAKYLRILPQNVPHSPAERTALSRRTYSTLPQNVPHSPAERTALSRRTYRTLPQNVPHSPAERTALSRRTYRILPKNVLHSPAERPSKIDACKRTLNTNLNRTTMKVTHPDFIRYVFANYMNTSLSLRPTTGAMTAFMAIQLCDVVNMYGFGYDPRFPLNYYDRRSIPDQRKDGEIKEGAHDYSEERRLWEKLHAENIIFWHSRQNETVDTDIA